MVMGGNQPYFMPYIGYWQLINAVDVFIISDDYHYIEGGWVARNRILENGQPRYYNIELSHASSNKRINEIYISEEKFEKEKKLKRLRSAYGRAPYFAEGFALMQKILSYEELNLAVFLENSIRAVCSYLGVQTKFVRSSSIPGNCRLKKEHRIFGQCDYVGADTYINAIGGKNLYTFEQFREHGIQLGFIQTETTPYKQFWHDFVPGLSIIDATMFNPRKEIQRMLQQYAILWDDRT